MAEGGVTLRGVVVHARILYRGGGARGRRAEGTNLGVVLTAPYSGRGGGGKRFFGELRLARLVRGDIIRVRPRW